MNAHAARKRRLSLRGWIKWIPVLAIPFSILFFHAWINIQILRADYVLRELNKEARELTDKLSGTGIAEAYHEDPEVLAARAELLEFVQPKPGQREIIRGRISTTPQDINGFTVASIDASPMPEPAVDEARSARGNTLETVVPSAPAVAAPAPVESPAPGTVQSTPVSLEIAPAFDSVAAPAEPVAAPPETAKTVSTPVILDLPDDAFMVEPVNGLEANMGALESL